MKIKIKSVFEQISEKVFQMKTLNEAKRFVLDFIEGKEINEIDKKNIIREINNAPSLYKFQNYICNALLKYEGMGMNQFHKTAREAAHDEANNIVA